MIKIHVLHTGMVRVSPALPFGGDCNIIEASGITTPKSKWLWLPVSSYLIEHPQGLILVDCGWDRAMSPNGEYDKAAQVRSLGSRILYNINQGVLEEGAAVNEQLEAMGFKTSDLDYVLLTHLDCDHANGLPLVRDARHILVSRAEVEFASKFSIVNKIRYQKKWWKDVRLEAFDWNGFEGPARHSFDLFGDGSVMMINIPGHSDGLCAVKVTGATGRYALLFSDGGYSERSWRELLTSGVAEDKDAQLRSLSWVRQMSLSNMCVESLANHDTEVVPHVITL